MFFFRSTHTRVRACVFVCLLRAQVAAEALSFAAALLADYAATGSWTGNEVARAEQLRGAIERLGPAYVKVAQVRHRAVTYDA